MGQWPIENSETVFECPWFSVGYDDVVIPASETDRYYWIDRPYDGCGIVAVEDKKVVMVEQYRPKLQETLLECPGGNLEAGESYIEGAARELKEETGIVADELTHLVTYYPSDTNRYKRAVVVGEGLKEEEPDLDDSEYLTWKYVPVEEALSESLDSPTTGWTVTSLMVAWNQGYI